MKYFTSLVLALSLAGIATAQVDDRYMTKDEGNTQSQATSQRQSDRYSQDQYSSQDQSYVDYDDNSYTTRIRRFQRPLSISSYYGSVYSPFYFDPFYSNPYNSWGSFYQPGYSVGFGYGPYWSSCWGQSAWFGFSPFSYWNVGFGFGGGYGFNNFGYGGFGGYGYGGYWNGYYAGLYDGGGYGNRYGNGFRNTVNYGPRVNTRGATGYNGLNGSRQASNSRLGNGAAINGRGIQVANNSRTVNVNDANVRLNSSRSIDAGNSGRVQNGNVRSSTLDNGNRINNYNSVGRGTQVQPGNQINRGSVDYQQQPATQPRVRSGIFGNGRSNNIQRDNGSFQSAPAQRQQVPVQRNPAPQRSFTPAPSRSSGGSFSPAPSRSSGGGGSRGTSIRR